MEIRNSESSGSQSWMPRGFIWCHGQDLSPWLGAFSGTECPGLLSEPCSSWTANAFLRNSSASAEPGVVLFTNNPSLQAPSTFGHLLLGFKIFWQVQGNFSSRLFLQCCAVAPGALRLGSPVSTAHFLLTPCCGRQCMPGLADEQG